MESWKLEDCLKEITKVNGDVIGSVLADKHGLCLAVSGKAKQDCSGIVAAIAQQVSKLEPDSPSPIILLENDNRKCLIQQSSTVTAAIFKKNNLK